MMGARFSDCEGFCLLIFDLLFINKHAFINRFVDPFHAAHLFRRKSAAKTIIEIDIIFCKGLRLAVISIPLAVLYRCAMTGYNRGAKVGGLMARG
jgi:hypothetical protein